MRILGKRGRTPEPTPAAAAAPEPEATAISVLVVDDEEDVRELIALALLRDGFDVVGTAGSAAEAVSLAERAPDIILLDLHMPDMGGLELLPLLRAHAPAAKVVACSAISSGHMVDACLEARVHGFIVKGVSAASIAQHLRRVAESGSARVVRPYPLNRDYAAAEQSGA